MKNLKTSLFAMTILVITFNACKKDKYQLKGDYATTQQVNDNLAKHYDFSITFSPSITFGIYNLPLSVTDNDAVIVYWYRYGTSFLIQTPYIWYETPSSNGVQFWTERLGVMLTVHGTRADGSSASPWAVTSVQNFRAVVIKGSARDAHPNVDYSNYEEVKKTFNLPN